MFKSLVFSLGFLSLNLFADTAHFQGFVEIEAGKSLYVDWMKASANKPTVILLNGLTYSTTYYSAFANELSSLGYGVFRYDPIGMGQTLLRYAPIKSVIAIEDQARDLDLLTKKLALNGRLNLFGLSYGGGLAIAFAQKYASRIGNAILVAPYTEPLNEQDSQIRSKIAWVRLTQPFNPATDEELYAYFLRENVYYVYPATEPSMLENIFKPEAVFQMTQGIRKFDILTASQKFPARSVHLMIAGKDQYIPREILLKFWDQLPVDARASQTTILLTEHKIPEVWPKFLAGLVGRVLEHKPEMFRGEVLIANPLTGQISK